MQVKQPMCRSRPSNRAGAPKCGLSTRTGCARRFCAHARRGKRSLLSRAARAFCSRSRNCRRGWAIGFCGGWHRGESSNINGKQPSALPGIMSAANRLRITPGRAGGWRRSQKHFAFDAKRKNPVGSASRQPGSRFGEGAQLLCTASSVGMHHERMAGIAVRRPSPWLVWNSSIPWRA